MDPNVQMFTALWNPNAWFLWMSQIKPVFAYEIMTID
jgi:hypothetical protein